MPQKSSQICRSIGSKNSPHWRWEATPNHKLWVGRASERILHFAILQLLIEQMIHHECMLPSRPPMAGNYALGPWKMFFVGQRETGTDHCQRQSDARCGRTITFTLPSLQRLILDPLCDAFDKILPAPDTYAALEDVTFWEFESNEFKHISIWYSKRITITSLYCNFWCCCGERRTVKLDALISSYSANVKIFLFPQVWSWQGNKWPKE